MHPSQLMISGDLRPLARSPFRPLAAMAVTIASWVLGCALTGDTKDDTKAGLHAAGPVVGCFMTAKIDCPLRCSEIDFDAVCDATLGATCDGQCGAEATGTCLDDCNADCSIGCKAGVVNDCQGSCFNRCDDSCRKMCAGAINTAQCLQGCGGDCRSTCFDTCHAQADSSCDGNCKASCNATCSVEAKVACQIKCSVQGFTTCKAKVAAQCVSECSSAVMLTCSDPNGAPADDDEPIALTGEDAEPHDAPWTAGLADKVGLQRGLAKHAPRADGSPPPDAPPLVEALPPEATDAGAVAPQSEDDPGGEGEGADDEGEGADDEGESTSE